MIELYCTIKNPVSGTTTVLFDRPVAIKKLVMWGATVGSFRDAATIPTAAAGRVVAELRGTTNLPIDSISCETNEILQCDTGLAFISTGVGAELSVRIYTMGNPTGSQGS